MSGEYSLAEMMVIQAARELAGAGRVFVGMGLPMLATALAKYGHDPDLMFITEAGISDWDPALAEVDHAPFGVADPVLDRGASYVGDMVDALGGWLMGGRVDVAVLTGAEIDRFGNLNTLLVGDRANPAVRLPGTGGNTDAACVASRVVSIVSLEPRRFVERVSFITSPGYISGPGARRAAGLRPQGENLVISTMAVFDFDTKDGGESGSCELRLRKLLPGIPLEAVQALLPWEVLVAEDLEECPPPDGEELRLLRHLDPGPVYLRPGRY